MTPLLDLVALCRLWLRSREEDTSTEMIYRPADFAFPPSRGRPGMEFGADGTFKRIGIGRTDISAVAAGTWRIVDPDAGRIQVEIDKTREDLTVRSLDSTRLAIARRE